MRQLKSAAGQKQACSDQTIRREAIGSLISQLRSENQHANVKNVGSIVMTYQGPIQHAMVNKSAYSGE